MYFSHLLTSTRAAFRRIFCIRNRYLCHFYYAFSPTLLKYYHYNRRDCRKIEKSRYRALPRKFSPSLVDEKLLENFTPVALFGDKTERKTAGIFEKLLRRFSFILSPVYTRFAKKGVCSGTFFLVAFHSNIKDYLESLNKARGKRYSKIFRILLI